MRRACCATRSSARMIASPRNGPMSAERAAWIELASTSGIGDELFVRLVETFGSAAGALEATRDGRLDAWNAERRKVEGRPPITRPVRERLAVTATQPGSKLAALAELGLWTFTPLDADYPPRLRDLDPLPLTIHGLGDPDLLFAPRCVAVVGTRRPTVAGRALTTRICARLVEAGAVVVSGLAVGIDGAAHAATVEHAGRTVAVIGAGHRLAGPRAHARLLREIVDRGGAVISEHHPDTKPTLGTFPRRNRIIAALGDATIVVEAPAISGALITARLALDMGRPLFVAPGRVGDWSVTGSLRLLRDSPARPIVGMDELLGDLGYLEPPAPAQERHTATSGPQSALAMLGSSEQAIARRLLEGPAGLDTLVAATGLPPAVASSAVTLLQMRGWVQPVGSAYMVAGALAR